MYMLNFELIYGLFLNLLCPVVAKTVIMLKVVVRNPLPASWKSRLQVELNFSPVHVALCCLGRATMDGPFGRDLAGL